MAWQFADELAADIRTWAHDVHRQHGGTWVISVDDLEQEGRLYLATHPIYQDYTPGARAYAVRAHLAKFAEREIQRHDKDVSYEDWAIEVQRKENGEH